MARPDPRLPLCAKGEECRGFPAYLIRLGDGERLDIAAWAGRSGAEAFTISGTIIPRESAYSAAWLTCALASLLSLFVVAAARLSGQRN